MKIRLSTKVASSEGLLVMSAPGMLYSTCDTHMQV